MGKESFTQKLRIYLNSLLGEASFRKRDEKSSRVIAENFVGQGVMRNSASWEQMADGDKKLERLLEVKVWSGLCAIPGSLDSVLWNICIHWNVLRHKIMIINRRIIGNREKDGLEWRERMSSGNWVIVLQEWAVLSWAMTRVAQLLYSWQILMVGVDLRRSLMLTDVIFLFCTENIPRKIAEVLNSGGRPGHFRAPIL